MDMQSSKANSESNHYARWIGVALAVVVSALLGGCGTSTLPAAPTLPASWAAAPPAPTTTPPTAPAYWPTAGWRTSTPEEQGIDSA